MNLHISIFFTAIVLATGPGLAKASQPSSQVVFKDGDWVILDHDRLPKPRLEKIARGVYIDPRLLQELRKPQLRKSAK